MNKFYLALVLAFLCISGVQTKDHLTWVLEIFPIVIAGICLIWTYKNFPLSPLAYFLIFLHALVLIYGGWYTYANTPLGNWVRDVLDLERNPYDRLGHFFQGFVPAIIAKELFVRIGKFESGKLLNIATVLCCLGISAVYELIEWWAALALGQGANEFLGMQGDVWDTQWDMFLAMIGACTSLIVLSKPHLEQVKNLKT